MDARTLDPPKQLDIAALAEQREPGLSLQAPFYTSDEVYQADIAGIFSKQWIFVASEGEIPDAGDYVTINLGTYSVIVVRDDDEEVRALHNVCRHRGARILNDAQGSVGNLVCGYHHWAYATDGRLRARTATTQDFDKSVLRPQAGRTSRWSAAWCSSAWPTSLLRTSPEVADAISPYIAPHQLADQGGGPGRPGRGGQLEAGDGEQPGVLPLRGGHPELIRTFFPTYGYRRTRSRRGCSPPTTATCRRDGAAGGLRRASACPTRAVEELDTGSRRSGSSARHWTGRGSPTRWTARRSRAGCSATSTPAARPGVGAHPAERLVPLLSRPRGDLRGAAVEPGRTLVRTTWLVHEDAEEGADYDLETLTHVWRETNAQDAAFCARAQLGVGHPGLRAGPVHAQRVPGRGVLTWYIDRMQEHRRMTVLTHAFSAMPPRTADRLACGTTSRSSCCVSRDRSGDRRDQRASCSRRRSRAASATCRASTSPSRSRSTEQLVSRCYTISSPATRPYADDHA